MTQGTQHIAQSHDTDSSPVGSGPLSRRRMLAVGSVGLLGVGALAACGDDTAADPATTSTDGAGSGSAPASDGVTLKLSDLPVGTSVTAKLDGKDIIVTQVAADQVVALSAVCPHAFCSVAPAGKELNCPCHQSTFDPATGENLSGPAAGKPLTKLTATIAGTDVVVKA